MKKVIYHSYGTAEELSVAEVDEPQIHTKSQIKVKVLYSSLNAIDWKNRKGDFRFVSGWFKPRTMQGFDVCGVVVDLSEDVELFKRGDKIVGQLSNFKGGALSEYVILKTSQVIKVPDGIDDRQLGGLAMAGTTAWQALFENAKLKHGQKVLINGGSSGVGHLAIQIAKAHGAEVTSVSSRRNFELCKSLGADRLIDYATEDFRISTHTYDIIFDVVFNASLASVKDILNDNGVYIGTSPKLRLLKDVLFTKNAKLVTVRPNTDALNSLVSLMVQKKLMVRIDKLCLLDEIVAAHKMMESSRTRGKIIMKIAETAEI